MQSEKKKGGSIKTDNEKAFLCKRNTKPEGDITTAIRSAVVNDKVIAGRPAADRVVVPDAKCLERIDAVHNEIKPIAGVADARRD